MLLHGIESYIGVPLNRRDGSYFGTLCALDPQAMNLSDADFEVFQLLSQLISFELEADEQRRKREAEKRALEDIIAIAAHDLRQPLAVLSGRAELLTRQVRRGATTEQLLDGLNGIVAQVRRATRLSEALLDVAQIEMGGFTVSAAHFDLIEMVRQAVEDAQTSAPAHTFLLDTPATLLIWGDERRLGEVVHNLLDNAAKYTAPDSGPVVLSIAVLDTPERPQRTRLCVRDHGRGVGDDALGRLFERQYRAPDATRQGVRGTGLGLYIVRQIVEAHGGSVWAEHVDGGGLRVCLDLPMNVDTEGGNAHHRPAA
ncbi:MAG: HAMP domain-containing histidine kinase [Herpetosiphonaceae bacterium]|nr:HAMP domain-containing histidine kinase [Herpetosiphonaceae bacterium]